MTRFHKILIANRGEIACRVIRTAHALGYRTVTVYSDADRDARHVQLADEAIGIGPSPVGQSYLVSDKLIDAAQRTGADAIHPGYGFLSENADFAATCAKAGLVFIGPPVDAIHLMGSKRQSKLAMLKAGVPCVPGYEGDAQDEATLLQEARRIGFPLMIKASAGGGGRGMRLVQGDAELAESLHTARSEAINAFGSGELILEKAVIAPRHVELQVFGDRHGNYVYLGERDCSIQRRHQKVVEEAPCPVMTPELRARMGEAAVAAARACDYVGAGTVEFLLDASGEFYFLEMNTRLQVEHPVTEMITGLDLVEWQLRVAAGEPLPLQQEQIRLHGHAIEVRLYAEDPGHNYLPQTGPVVAWRPATGDGVRIDHGMVEGGAISPFYDPMVAKVIAWGANREEAARRLARALDDTVLLGVHNNKRFLINILRHDTFLAGDTSTAFLATHFADDPTLQPAVPTLTDIALAAAIVCLHGPAEQGWHTGLVGERPMLLELNGQRYPLSLRQDGDALTVTRVGHDSLTLSGLRLDAEQLHYQQDGIRRRRAYGWQQGTLYLDGGHGNWVVNDLTHQPEQRADDGHDGRLLASMDGAVVAIRVQAGDTVEAGQTLVVLDAMKIEHQLKARVGGVVASVHAEPGQQVRKRQLLVTLTPST